MKRTESNRRNSVRKSVKKVMAKYTAVHPLPFVKGRSYPDIVIQVYTTGRKEEVRRAGRGRSSCEVKPSEKT